MHREDRVPSRRRPSARLRLGLLLLALVSLLALTGCGSSQGAGSGSSSQPAARASGLPPTLTAAFALLRQPAEGLPASIRRVVGDPVPGIEWQLAKRVRVSAPGTYWLAPGRKNVCLLATRPHSPVVGTVCATVAQALHHGIANTSLDPSTGKRMIVGVVPDGTRTVTIASGNSHIMVTAPHGQFVHRDSIPLPPDRLVLHPRG